MPDAGKGSRYRPVNRAAWEKGYARAFGNHFAKTGKKVKRLWAAKDQLIRAVVKRRAD